MSGSASQPRVHRLRARSVFGGPTNAARFTSRVHAFVALTVASATDHGEKRQRVLDKLATFFDR